MKKIVCIWLLILMMHSAVIAQNETTWTALKVKKANTILQVTGKVIPQEGALSIESSRFQGRIVNLLKREGERVKIGDPLFTVSSAECVTLVQEEAVAEKLNLKELLDSTLKRQKQLGLDIQGDSCVMLASHAGTINKINVGNGTAFNLGDPLLTIVDIGKLTIELDIPENQISQVRVGQQVKVRFSSLPDQVFQTSIQHILPSIDPMTRMATVRLRPIVSSVSVLDALVFAEINQIEGYSLYSVPSQSLVFFEDVRYVIKKIQVKGVVQYKIVPVQVVDENEDESMIRPLRSADLSLGNQIATDGAIYLFRKLKNEKTH